MRNVDLKNEFLNKVKNLFNIFKDFTVMNEEKTNMLDNYINVRVNLIKEKFDLSANDSSEFEKKFKS